MIYYPHSYQLYAKDRIIDLKACGLFLEPGLGKTSIALTAINELIYERFEVSKVLVIAPKRVAEDTWTSEAEKWDHLQHLRISKVLGSASQRIDALKMDADIYVMNRENVCWLIEYLGKNWDFDMLVVDELSSFKSNQAKRFRALRRVRPLVSRFVGLTGTPAPNGLMDLWPEVYLIDMGERLGKTISGYRERYFYPAKSNGYAVYSWEPKPGAQEVIHQKISDVCISMRAGDYLGLREPIIRDVKIRLSPDEVQLYKRLEREKLLSIGESEITAFTAASVWGKLLQMANGAVYDKGGDVVEIHQKKLEALEDIVEEANGSPVMVVYNYKHDYDRLMRRFAAYRPRTLQGQQDIRDWNAEKIPLLLAQPASMGHGLNIQDGGHIIVWFGLNPSLELYQQTNDRLQRQGQKALVIIIRLICEGTVDEDVIQKLSAKDANQLSLLEAVKARIRRVKDDNGTV
jgi:SNF2 family DNA or RNA helicase